ncbi:hypothetical protein WMF04_05505 [Sorangium sp. So ce260]|uniref:hypothetical protein n=1 Tax=Sorangium sp. So ce260 TaxID=3133291 RepID=UPI003F5F7DD2
MASSLLTPGGEPAPKPWERIRDGHDHARIDLQESKSTAIRACGDPGARARARRHHRRRNRRDLERYGIQTKYERYLVEVHPDRKEAVFAVVGDPNGARETIRHDMMHAGA